MFPDWFGGMSNLQEGGQAFEQEDERKQTTPLVSVIIPAHNMESFVEQAVHSVLAQTYQNLEVIVVDDNSEDNTLLAVRNMPDPRILTIHHNETRGPSSARNTGVLAAKGTIMAFLDADDVWLPSKLEKQVGLLLCRNELGFVYCGVHEVDRSLHALRTPAMGPAWPAAGHDAFVRILEQQHFVVAPLSTMVLRKACFDECGLFDEEIVQGEEWDLLFRIAYHWRIGFVPEPLALYRMTGHFIPQKRLKRCIGKAHEKTIERAFARIGNPPELKELKTVAMLRVWWIVALYQYAVHKPDLAIIQLHRIAAVSPDYLDFASNRILRDSLAYTALGLYDTVTPIPEALQFVDYVFDHWPPIIRYGRSDRRTVKAQVAAIIAFDSYQRGEVLRTLVSSTLALFFDPPILRNRGLLRIPISAVSYRWSRFATGL